MNKLRSSFYIEIDRYGILLISDNCNKENTMSITNDAENVIKFLYKNKILKNKRLFYIDSEGRIDELLHKDGKFINFKSGFNDFYEFNNFLFKLEIENAKIA